MPSRKKPNWIMLALLAVGGYFVYTKFFAGNTNLPGSAPSSAVAPGGPDPTKLAYLRDWAKGYGITSPEFYAMDQALSQMTGPQIDTMYTAVSVYFGSGANLPGTLNDQVDSIARQYHILGR